MGAVVHSGTWLKLMGDQKAACRRQITERVLERLDGEEKQPSPLKQVLAPK